MAPAITVDQPTGRPIEIMSAKTSTNKRAAGKIEDATNEDEISFSKWTVVETIIGRNNDDIAAFMFLLYSSF